MLTILWFVMKVCISLDRFFKPLIVLGWPIQSTWVVDISQADGRWCQGPHDGRHAPHHCCSQRTREDGRPTLESWSRSHSAKRQRRECTRPCFTNTQKTHPRYVIYTHIHTYIIIGSSAVFLQDSHRRWHSSGWEGVGCASPPPKPHTHVNIYNIESYSIIALPVHCHGRNSCSGTIGNP